MKASSVLLILVFLMCGCMNRELNPVDYLHWVDNKDNGLIQERTENDLLIEVKYKPVDYMVLQSMQSKLGNKAEYDSLRKRFEGFDYFNLRLSSSKAGTSFIKAVAGNDEDFFRLKEYFYFHFNENIYMEVDGKRLECDLYHFEDTYELSKYETVVLGFKNSGDDKKEKRLVIDSDVLRTGILKFTFGNNVLNKIPSLKRD